MKYMIKIGDNYLHADGMHLTSVQSQALKLSDDCDYKPRIVKLTPKRDPPSDTNPF